MELFIICSCWSTTTHAGQSELTDHIPWCVTETLTWLFSWDFNFSSSTRLKYSIMMLLRCSYLNAIHQKSPYLELQIYHHLSVSASAAASRYQKQKRLTSISAAVSLPSRQLNTLWKAPVENMPLKPAATGKTINCYVPAPASIYPH